MPEDNVPMNTETNEGAQVEDLTTKVVDSTPDIDKAEEKKGALSDADQAKIGTMQSLLDEHDINSPEELKEFVANLATLKDNVGNENLEELKANSKLLKRYQEKWAADESKKLEDNETPEETIDRLKKEKQAERKQRTKEQEQREEARENRVLLDSFNKSVKSQVNALKDFPESYRGVLVDLLGVDNEINEIDLDDKASIKRVTKAKAKVLMDHEQVVIKRYLKGKAKVVKMTTTTGEETPPATKTVKNLKSARSIMKERLGKIFAKA
ncbi:MAG: hypothetical protein BBJ57_07440 [Desulfobacterales bacterium PC51MH44]|nr:MAG: hypothetical protein BBJ57_07440 [Desulfobacterales bacterium PC51MH44]